MSSNKTTLMELFTYESVRTIESLEIKNCHGSPLEVVDIHDNAMELNKLRTLTIENCQLTQVPSALISKTSKLESVTLNNNKIEYISTHQLKAASKSVSDLRYLTRNKLL